ncbi:MAG: 6-phosphogluconolactonase [Nitrospinota bacterium]
MQLSTSLNRQITNILHLTDMKNKRLEIVDNAAALAQRGAEIFRDTAIASISKHGRFSVALSGGSTPRGMNRLLAAEPYISTIPWEKVDIFWVDERIISYTNPDSNFGTAKKDFIDKIPIPHENVHPMPVDISTEKGAKQYERDLKEYFKKIGKEEPSFDLIILGVGEDGHTASIFPNANIDQDDKRWVIGAEGGTPPLPRLTMTYEILNRSSETIFLASGETKGEILKKILEENLLMYPAERIKTKRGEPLWVVYGGKETSRKFSKLRGIAAVKMTTDNIMSLTRKNI